MFINVSKKGPKCFDRYWYRCKYVIYGYLAKKSLVVVYANLVQNMKNFHSHSIFIEEIKM
jgi:hypothetical protein